MYLSCVVANFCVFLLYSRQVIEGVDVLRRLEEIPTSNERPKFDCKVSDCGIFKLEKLTPAEQTVTPLEPSV